MLAVVAVVGSPSLTSIAARGTYLLLALYALQVLVRETAQPSLGHAAFLAVGAYLTAALRTRLGADGLGAAVAVTIVGGAAGWLMGWGATRLPAPILALLTWAFGWLVYVALGAFPEVTGGVAGISLRGPLHVVYGALGVDVRVNELGHLLLGSVLLAVVLLLYRSAQQSVIGRGWSALRDSPSLASSLGYNVSSIRRWTFAISAALAALAGSLAAQLIQVVDPTLYSPLASLNLFVAVLIGAPLGFFGPIAGAAVITGAPLFADQLSAMAGLPVGPGRQLVASVLTILALGLSFRFRRDR